MLGSYRRAALAVVVASGFLAAGCAETRLAVYAAKRATKEIESVVRAAPDEAPIEAVEEIQESPPASSPHYKVGDPYEVAGVWYYPRVDPDYDRTGIGSWYGLPFHGRDTANGETYDMNELTAAHKTLPMPTMVRVTNLENGRSLVLRGQRPRPLCQRPHHRCLAARRTTARLRDRRDRQGPGPGALGRERGDCRRESDYHR